MKMQKGRERSKPLTKCEQKETVADLRVYRRMDCGLDRPNIPISLFAVHPKGASRYCKRHAYGKPYGIKDNSENEEAQKKSSAPLVRGYSLLGPFCPFFVNGLPRGAPNRWKETN
jgi:hypothetical protein